VGQNSYRSYRFRAAPLEVPAGSSATYAWEIWIQPQEANSLNLAASWDDLDSDQEFADSASSSFPTAQIHPLVFLPGAGATQPPTYNQTLADLVLMLGNRIAHYNEFYDGLERMGYERGRTYFLFPYDWLRSSIEAARHLHEERLAPAAEAASSVPWVSGFGEPAAVDFDLVGHSTGALVARAYIQGPSWNENVHRFVSIGGPHLGVYRGYSAYEGIAPEDSDLDRSVYYLWAPPRAFLAGYGHLSCVPLLGCRWVLTMDDRYQFAHDPIAGLTILPEFLPIYGDYLANENGLPAEPAGPFPFGRMANPLLEGQDAVDHQQVLDPWTDNPHLTSIPEGFQTTYYGLNTSGAMQTLDQRLAGAAENVCVIFGGGVNLDTALALEVAAPEPQAPYWLNGRLEGYGLDVGDTLIPAISANPAGIWPGQGPRSIDLDPLLAAQGDLEADHARMVGYDLTVIETMRCLTGLEVPQGLLSGYSSGPAAVGPESRLAAEASEESARTLVITALNQVEMTLTDAQGRRLGYNAAGQDFNEIPSGLYVRDDQSGQNHLIVYEPSSGDYVLAVTGNQADHGDYTVIGMLQDGEQVINLFVAEDAVDPGETNDHPTSIPEEPGTYPTPPEVDAGPDLEATAGEEISFSGTVHDVNPNDTHSFTWDFGDGTSAAGDLHPTHSYAQAGVYEVMFTVVDSAGFSASDTLQVTVRALTGPPLAQDDAFGFDEDTPLSIEAPGLLANDSDPDGDALTTVLASPPSNGTLTLQPDGAFRYAPGSDFNGSDAFTYQAHGGDQLSNTATVSLTIRPVNDPPIVATGPDASIRAGEIFAGIGSFGDPDQGDSWTAVADYGDGSGPHGLALASDKTFALSHLYPDSGTYVVSVTVQDAAGSTAVDSLTVTVAPVAPPGPPLSIGDYVILAEDFVRIGVGARVESGAVGVNSGPDGAGSDEVILEAYSRLSDDTALAADSLTLRRYARASGDAYYNDLNMGWRAVIGGEQHSPLALPLLELPPLPAFEIGPAARNVNIVRSGRLSPGDYRVVTVWPFGTLRLTGGIYEFQRLRIFTQARVICLAACEIRVVDVVRMHQGADLIPGPGLESRDVLVLIAAEEGVALEAYGGNRLSANVLAPWGRLRLGTRGRFEGAFLAHQVVLGASARVVLGSGFGE
jgi:PKD repeat protein